MPARKIQDEQEIIRWIEQGKTYKWMSEEYLRKYNIETNPSLFSMFRRRHGLDARIVHDGNLIPWHVLPKHRWRYPLQMLRAEARSRSGAELREYDQERLPLWHQFLADNGVVVHYDPELEEGFVYVPRESRDDDIIRRPSKATSRRSTGNSTD